MGLFVSTKLTVRTQRKCLLTQPITILQKSENLWKLNSQVDHKKIVIMVKAFLLLRHGVIQLLRMQKKISEVCANLGNISPSKMSTLYLAC